MWRCEKCETMNEDYYDSCSICHYEKNNRTKTEISSSSFYDDWEKEPISRKDFNQNRKSKNVLKVLVIVMVVLLVIFGFLFIALIAINQEAFAIASNCENRIQGGVQYVLQPMREILAG
jgi:flagellar biosynthesis/type III secretory pathway M-ring protein FliF/YscJ